MFDVLFQFTDKLRAALAIHGIRLLSVGATWEDTVDQDQLSFCAECRLPDGRTICAGFPLEKDTLPEWDDAASDRLIALVVAELEKGKVPT